MVATKPMTRTQQVPQTKPSQHPHPPKCPLTAEKDQLNTLVIKINTLLQKRKNESRKMKN
jgi:hypothetical protein